jgi:hypothetical protein
VCLPAFVSSDHDGSLGCCAAIPNRRFWWDSEHSSVMKRSQGHRCMSGVSHLKKAEQRLKTCKDYTFCRESYGQSCFGTLNESYSSILTQQRTINAAYYSKLLKDRVKPSFRSKRRRWSFKSVCLLHDNARPHTAAVTTGTLEEMHWEVVTPPPPNSPDLSSADFYLFGPFREAVKG